MTTSLPTDVDIDPLERQDLEEEAEQVELVVVEDEHATPVASEIDGELEKELEIITKSSEEADPDAAVRTKAQMISDDLIRRPLQIDDLFDKGSI